MNIKFLFVAGFIGLGASIKVHAQNKRITPEFIQQQETLEQACLDKGDNMWQCSQDYYSLMDSLLNVVYRSIKATSSPEAFKRLKEDELKWLEKRDKEFVKIDKESEKNDLDVTDQSMIAFDQKAEFVKERVLFLLKNY